MPIPLAIAAYFTIWWITLFAVLPFGVRSAVEAGATDAPPGSDPGAPVAANIKTKLLWTTGLAAIVFAGLDAFIYFTD